MKLIVFQTIKKFYKFNGTQRFSTVLTRARHWTITWSYPQTYLKYFLYYNPIHVPVTKVFFLFQNLSKVTVVWDFAPYSLV